METLKPAKAMAEEMMRLMLLDAVKERLNKDGIPINNNLNPENVEETIAVMVEGDQVLDDAEVHNFFRKLLDEHRAAMARLDEFFD